MIEKVNPGHPDKIADRIAGALVDIAYNKQANPKIAVEVLIGHGACHIISESSVNIETREVESVVKKLAGQEIAVDFKQYVQDPILAANQIGAIRCGDNGIFAGVPTSEEEHELSRIARKIYERFPYDGKYIIDGKRLIVCQSNATTAEILKELTEEQLKYDLIVNPLGDWRGGTDTDTGATNRKLGSDMGRAVTGGGLHGKDLSKADVTLNICMYLFAQNGTTPKAISCAIGDEKVLGIEYFRLVDIARSFIESKGGFEKFAEWGFI